MHWVGQISTSKFFLLVKITCMLVLAACLKPKPMRHFMRQYNFMITSNMLINAIMLLFLPKSQLEALNKIESHLPLKLRNLDTDYEDHLLSTFTRIILPKIITLTPLKHFYF